MVFSKKTKSFIIIDKNYLKLFQVKRRRLVFKKNFSYNSEKTDLKEIMKDVQKPLREVTILIPGNRVFVGFYNLPRDAGDKLNDIININFMSRLSVDKNNLYHSYYIEKNNKKDKLKVITFAVKKDYIDKFYNKCDKAGLEIKNIIPLSIYFYIYHNGGKRKKESKKIFIDSLDDIHNLTILGSDKIYIKGFIGGEEVLVEEVKKAFQYSTELIEEKDKSLFINTRLIKKDFIKNAEKGEYDWDFLQEELQKENTENLELDFWKSTYKFNPPEHLDLKENIKIVQDKKKKKENLLIKFIVVLIIALNAATMGLKWLNSIERLEAVETEIKLGEHLVSEVNKIKNDYADKREQLNIYQNLMEKSHDAYLPYLIELTKILPYETEVITLNFNDDKLTMLEGTSRKASTVLAVLESSDYFHDISFDGSIATEGDRERFRIVGELIDEFE